MTDQQTTAMTNFSNRWANAVFNEMRPYYFPSEMTEEEIEGAKKYYRILGRAIYKVENNLDTQQEPNNG